MERKTYKYDDKILFIVRGETYPYTVCSNHLKDSTGESNSRIFKALGINDKNEFCTKAYGYANYSGGFPECKEGDYEALNRVINALFDVCDAKDGKVTAKISTKSPEEILQYFIDLGIKDGTRYIDTSGNEHIAHKIPELSSSQSYIDCGAGYLWNVTQPDLLGKIVQEAKISEDRDNILRLEREAMEKLISMGAVGDFKYTDTRRDCTTKNSRKPEINSSGTKDSYIDAGPGFLWEFKNHNGYNQFAIILPKEEDISTCKPTHPTLEEIMAKYPNGTKVNCCEPSIGGSIAVIDYDSNSLRYFEGAFDKIDYMGLPGFLYYQGKWATILEEATSKSTEAKTQKTHLSTGLHAWGTRTPVWPEDELREKLIRNNYHPVTPTVAAKAPANNTNKVESLPLYKIKQF
jgi:hypothetical protein